MTSSYYVFGDNKMNLQLLFGILLPFFGTAIGAAVVFFGKTKRLSDKNELLSGFASGVMMAASVWSLIIPAVEMCSDFGFFGFVPMILGLWFGLFFMLFLEKHSPHFFKEKRSEKSLFYLAVVLHNIPEGMAVGASFACAANGNLIPALLLSLGIALQNIPEGAIISAPLRAEGKSRRKSFAYGALSGAVEPAAAIFTLMFSAFATSVLPYLLGFAAGAMICVTLKELLPRATENKGVLWFFVGFSLMAVLDIALG